MAVFPVQLLDPVEAGALGHVDLAADDRADAALFGGLVEIQNAVHVAVVGDGHSLLPQFLGAVQKALNAAGAIQEAVFGVDMEMGESHRRRLQS